MGVGSCGKNPTCDFSLWLHASRCFGNWKSSHFPVQGKEVFSSFHLVDSAPAFGRCAPQAKKNEMEAAESGFSKIESVTSTGQWFFLSVGVFFI